MNKIEGKPVLSSDKQMTTGRINQDSPESSRHSHQELQFGCKAWAGASKIHVPPVGHKSKHMITESINQYSSMLSHHFQLFLNK